MSQPFIPVQPGPIEEPAPKRRRWPWVVGIVLAASVGFGAGTSGQATGPAAVTPPVPAEPEVVTETVTEIPQSCLDALDAADTTFEDLTDFAIETNDLNIALHEEIIAILNADGYLITEEWNELDTRYAAQWPELGATSAEAYGTAKAECRGTVQ